MKKFAIIVAGGSGKRMNSSVPKQFLLLHGKPLLFHTLHAFLKAIPGIGIILVLPKNQFRYWDKLCREFNFNEPVTLAEGGKERFYSVKNGLDKIKSDGLVAVHDGVRPFISGKTILHAFKAAEKKGNAIPAIPVKETLRRMKENDSEAVDRSRFCLVQTPQCFKVRLLKKAYLQQFSARFTDDATVAENAGLKINLVEGDPDNIKITTPADFELAEAMMSIQL